MRAETPTLRTPPDKETDMRPIMGHAIIKVVALTFLGACVPIPKPVDLSGSIFQESRTPLAADDAIVVLAQSSSDDDFRITACVREAVADISDVRIVPADQFRYAAGLFATASVPSEEAIGEALRRASSADGSTLKPRYVFIAKGTTATSERDRLGVPIMTIVARWSDEKRTDIEVTAWDAINGQRLESITTSASGVEATTFVGLYAVIGFAPTESRACRAVARKITRYISGVTDADKNNR
jgi:hypothetical protein